MYKPNPQMIERGTGTGNINQTRRKKDIGRLKGKKQKGRGKGSQNALKSVGALS